MSVHAYISHLQRARLSVSPPGFLFSRVDVNVTSGGSSPLSGLSRVMGMAGAPQGKITPRESFNVIPLCCNG